MPLSEGWRDQYERMLRSRARLAEAVGASSGDDARDMLYDFFQDAYQLKDWIINDLRWYTMQGKKKELTQDGQDLESHITATVPLARCADICNGTKHLTLDRPRIPGKPAEVAGQGRSLTLGVFETRAEFGPVEYEAEEPSEVLATYTWVVTWDGGRSDAVQLADQVIAEWDAWLNAAAQRKLL
jgi:hypothetical protein